MKEILKLLETIKNLSLEIQEKQKEIQDKQVEIKDKLIQLAHEKQEKKYIAEGKCKICGILISEKYIEMQSKNDPRKCYSCGGDEMAKEETGYLYKPKKQI